MNTYLNGKKPETEQETLADMRWQLFKSDGLLWMIVINGDGPEPEYAEVVLDALEKDVKCAEFLQALHLHVIRGKNTTFNELVVIYTDMLFQAFNQLENMERWLDTKIKQYKDGK